MHRSHLGEITIDCDGDDLESPVAFWSAVFGYEATSFENDYFLDTPDREVQINIQAVQHPPRVPLDIETDDIEAEAARLEGLGAKRIKKERRWSVMEALIGHRFCMLNVGRSGFETEATRWE